MKREIIFNFYLFIIFLAKILSCLYLHSRKMNRSKNFQCLETLPAIERLHQFKKLSCSIPTNETYR